MNKTFTQLLLLAIVCIAGYWLLQPDSEQSPPPRSMPLPWEIETHADGTSSVFGLQLETTTVAAALQLLGEDHELGIISDQQDRSGLEIYYSHFRAGPLKAKLILGVTAEQAELEKMQAAASVASYTSSGSRKFLLNESDLARIQQWPIASVTLIPAAQLDKDTIVARFGPPAKQVVVDDEETHFLYPEKGLDITHNSEAKELMQYVAPRSFEKLLLPLNSAVVQP